MTRIRISETVEMESADRQYCKMERMVRSANSIVQSFLIEKIIRADRCIEIVLNADLY